MKLAPANALDDSSEGLRRPCAVGLSPLKRPLRVGAISNPTSGRNVRHRQLEVLARLLSTYPECRHHEAGARADIIKAADELVRWGSEIIIVNGGDGTLQATLTALWRNAALDTLPLLVVIPGGTTNMIAADVGLGKAPLRSLEGALAKARGGRVEGKITQRPVMRLDMSSDVLPLYGMFVGAGAIYHGINFCLRRIHTLGLRGEIGPGVALAVFLGGLFLGRKGTLLPPLHASGSVDDLEITPTEYFGLLMTSLRRLFLGLRPFWGKEPGDLRYSAVSYSPRHMIRAAPSIMRGKPNEFVRPEHGYFSHNASEIHVRLDSGFTVDGELFEPEAASPLVIRGGHYAFFLSVTQT